MKSWWCCNNIICMVFQSKKDSQMTQTQSSYTSTQQSQLDTTEAVYPDLTSCSISVDKILPQLTSSLWYVYCIYRIFVMSVEAFSTDVIVFIGGVIMCFTSDWPINLHMRGKNWLNIFVDQGQVRDPDFISGTHQSEKCPICR